MLANHRSPGLAGARNTGVGLAQGALIAGCDDDDEWHPAKLRAQVARLAEQPDLLVVGSGMRLLLPSGKVISWPGRAERISYQTLLRNRVKELHSSTLVMRRDAFAKAGLYDEALPHGYAEDSSWVLRAARVGRIGLVVTPLADIRKDAGSWYPGNAAMTAVALEYLLAKHPDLAARPAWPGPAARPDRVRQIGARPASAGPALRTERDRPVAAVTACLPGAGAHRDPHRPAACAACGPAGPPWPGLAVRVQAAA